MLRKIIVPQRHKTKASARFGCSAGRELIRGHSSILGKFGNDWPCIGLQPKKMGYLPLGSLKLAQEFTESEDVNEGFALSLWSDAQQKFADNQIFVIVGRHERCSRVTAMFYKASDA